MAQSTNPNIVRLPTTPRRDVESEIRRIAIEDSSRVQILDHALTRMRERSITLRQVFQVLRHGELVAPPEWVTKKERGWKCKFRRITAGEHVNVIAKLVEYDDICVLVITVY